MKCRLFHSDAIRTEIMKRAERFWPIKTRLMPASMLANNGYDIDRECCFTWRVDFAAKQCYRCQMDDGASAVSFQYFRGGYLCWARILARLLADANIDQKRDMASMMLSIELASLGMLSYPHKFSPRNRSPQVHQADKAAGETSTARNEPRFSMRRCAFVDAVWPSSSFPCTLAGKRMVCWLMARADAAHAAHIDAVAVYCRFGGRISIKPGQRVKPAEGVMQPK